MANLNDLIVNGQSRFIGKIYANEDIVGNVDGSANSYYVKGTQTGTTNVWTGDLPKGVSKLYDGLTIDYFLPYAGNGSNVTLNIGGTGAKPVIIGNSATSIATTHYPQYSIIRMTYVIHASINSGSGAWKCTAYWDTTDYNQYNDYMGEASGTVGIVAQSLIMRTSNNKLDSIVTSSTTATTKSRNTNGFIVGSDLLYTGYTIAPNTSFGTAWRSMYTYLRRMDFRYSSNCGTGLTPSKPVYLVGKVTNGYFYLNETWWTQTIPTSEDGFVYVLVGGAYSNYQVDLYQINEWMHFKDGAFRPYISHSENSSKVNNHTVESDVPANAKFTDTDTTYSAGTGLTLSGTQFSITTDNANTIINQLSTGSSDPVDADYYISQYTGGGTSHTTFHRRPVSTLWNYIKGKISSVLGLTATNYSGKAATAGTADSATNANKVNNHTVESDVPANAKFTDTTYTFNTAYNSSTNKAATMSDITSAISGVTQFDYEVVTSLPTTGIKGKIYLISDNHGTNDVYDEYIYVSNKWEKIGNTDIDLSNYVQKDGNKVLSTNDFTTALKNKLDGIASNANNYSLPTASADTLGGIKVGNNLSISNGVLSATDTNTVTTATTTGSGNAVTSVTASNGALTVTKGSTFVDTTSDQTISGAKTFSGTTTISRITNGYINTHPENAGTLIPFINNDIAFLTKRGGSYEAYKTTETDFTKLTLAKSSTVNITDNIFDGSSSYSSYTVVDTNDVVVIDINMPEKLSYTTVFYIDFGNSGWRAKNIRVLVWDNHSENATQSYVQKFNVTELASGNYKNNNISHTFYKADGKTVCSYGFNKLRVVLTNFATKSPRIAQIGLLNYGSTQQRITTMSRGIDDKVWRGITPASSNTYNLGSNDYKWANVYATTFNGNATSATKATQDSDGNAINTTYAKKSSLATVATSGSYNDLSNKPTIPSAVTESTVSGWGFTKNTGTLTSHQSIKTLHNKTLTGTGNVTLTASDVGALPSTIVIPTVTDTYSSTSSNAMSGKAVASAISGKGTYSKPSDGIPATDLAESYYLASNPNGYTNNKGTVTKVNNTSPDANGNVSITIPSAVTETTVSGWGFTKNSGTYSKPSTGIPKTDLAEAVQTSLGKADTALQSYTEQYTGTVKKVNNTSPDANGNVTLTIPSAVTETTVSGWGFTKNAGTVTSVNNVSPVNGNVSLSLPNITSGTAVPSGGSNGDIYIQTEANVISDNYSTTETDTGKTWVDGRHIYRKVIAGTTSSISSAGTLATITHGISGFKLLINYSMICYTTEGSSQYYIPYNTTNGYAGLYQTTATQFIIRSSGAWNTSYKYYFIAEYIKS